MGNFGIMLGMLILLFLLSFMDVIVIFLFFVLIFVGGFIVYIIVKW